MKEFFETAKDYLETINKTWNSLDWNRVKTLSDELLNAWKSGNKVFICGNGGSAANANHFANDLLYGVSPHEGKGLKVYSLTANTSVNTCLANDTGFENIFAKQLSSLADNKDILIVFSGSGNSPNVVKALEQGKTMGMHTHAVLGFDGGKCKKIAENPIHLPLNDMQVAEDFQMIIGHILMKYLKGRK
jgi:D-sedoheptulose 7-phosphate isomerase